MVSEGVRGGQSSRCPLAVCGPRPASGPQEMVDWFNALRAARFHYLQVAFPGASDADVSGCCRCSPGVLPSLGWWIGC